MSISKIDLQDCLFRKNIKLEVQIGIGKLAFEPSTFPLFEIGWLKVSSPVTSSLDIKADPPSANSYFALSLANMICFCYAKSSFICKWMKIRVFICFFPHIVTHNVDDKSWIHVEITTIKAIQLTNIMKQIMQMFVVTHLKGIR